VVGDYFGTVIAAAQAGDEAAFAELWRDANPAILRYLRVIAPNAAEDVAAETWVTVIRGLGAFSGDEHSWRAWLFTIARSRAIDEGRRQRRRPVRPLEEAAEAVTTDAADIAITNLETERALRLIAALPPLQAEAIMLRVVAGLDTQAVAEMLGRSPGAVRVAAHRGLRRLAAMLAEAGVTL
jgi:RNA polymerase sigma-70 factor, ECF subfamily